MVTKSKTGEIVFSPPARFVKMPLRYDRAYGGHDKVAEAKHKNPFSVLAAYLQPPAEKVTHTPYRYLRNGVGKGFVIEDSDAALDALALPNLEDPQDRLTPSRLFVGAPQRWALMPLPWCTDWSSLATFPRFTYLGATPMMDLEGTVLHETRRSLVSDGFPRSAEVPPERRFSTRAFNAGSLGLQLEPFVAGAAGSIEFRLAHLHPERHRIAFHLPPDAPKIFVDGRDGKLLPTTPVLHHVVIEPDFDRVTVLWRGSAPARRRYAVEELMGMPLLVEW